MGGAEDTCKKKHLRATGMCMCKAMSMCAMDVPQCLFILPGPPSRPGQGSPGQNNAPSSLTCAPIVTPQACACTHTNCPRNQSLPFFSTWPKQRLIISHRRRCAKQRNRSKNNVSRSRPAEPASGAGAGTLQCVPQPLPKFATLSRIRPPAKKPRREATQISLKRARRLDESHFGERGFFVGLLLVIILNHPESPSKSHARQICFSSRRRAFFRAPSVATPAWLFFGASNPR